MGGAQPFCKPAFKAQTWDAALGGSILGCQQMFVPVPSYKSPVGLSEHRPPTDPPHLHKAPQAPASCAHSGWAPRTSRDRRGGPSSRGTRRQPKKPSGTVGNLEVPPSSSEAPNDQHLPILDFYNQMQLLTDVQFMQKEGRCSTQRFHWCSVWTLGSFLLSHTTGLGLNLPSDVNK